MPNSAYQRGDHFEKRVMADLTIDGYLVWQSRNSRSLADLIAIKPGQILFVQCKSGLTIPTHKEWNGLLMLATSVRAVPLIADRAGRGIIRYRQITDPHVERSQDWPARIWTADETALAAAMARHPAGKQK